MTIIVCIDECFGIAFGKKRQSRDRFLTRDAVEFAKNRRIVASPYSRLLFEEAEVDTDGIYFCDEPMKEAKDGDVIFLELAAPDAEIKKANEIVVYNWNRRYPATVKLNADVLKACFELKETFEFIGNSHEKLTRSLYKRK